MVCITSERCRTGGRAHDGALSIGRRPSAAPAGQDPRVAWAARRAMVEALEGRTLLSAGDLDPTFGGTGKVLTAFPPAAHAGATAVTFQGAKVLVGGAVDSAVGAVVAVARYNPDGSLDKTFGGGTGRVTTHINQGGDEGFALAGLVALPNGKIVAAANNVNSHHQFDLVRYNADGSLDQSFGNGGIQDVALSDYGFITDLAAGPDGSFHYTGVLGDDDNDFADILDDGGGFQIKPDPNTGGFGQYDRGNALAVGPDGQEVLAGTSSRFGAFVDRLGDPLFGRGGADGDGVVSGLASGADAVAVQLDGKVLVGGAHGVLRLNANGTLDAAFGGGDGRAAETFAVRDIAAQADGRIVLLGGTPGAGGTLANVSLFRLNADGSPDATFDAGDGKVPAPFASGTPAALALAADGKLAVAGAEGGKFAVARYKGTPTTDTIVVNGTGGNDTIKVTQSGTTLTINKNGAVTTLSTAGKARIVLNGLAGNDVLSVASNVTLQAFLYGGDGDDVLHAGGGKNDLVGGRGLDTADYGDRTAGLKISVDDLRNDGAGAAPSSDNVHTDVEVVLGGSGDDTLVGRPLATMLVGNGGNDKLAGGSDRDVLIGGKGKDDLTGNGGDDLLIDAATAHDANPTALRAVYREWANFAHTYPQRITALKSGVARATVKLNASTVVNDAAADTLRGGTGQDWFVDHAGDVVTDKAVNETLTTL